MESHRAEYKQKLEDYQASQRYFLDKAHECFKTCVPAYEQMELTMKEKDCVHSCFQKQMVLYQSFVSNL